MISKLNSKAVTGKGSNMCLTRRIFECTAIRILLLLALISTTGRIAYAADATVEANKTIEVFADDVGATISVAKTFKPPTGHEFKNLSDAGAAASYANHMPNNSWLLISNTGAKLSVTIQVASVGPADAATFAFVANGILVKAPAAGAAGAAGAAPPITWKANVKPNVLVLSDENAQAANTASDATGSNFDAHTPTLLCTAAADGKWDIEFYIKAEAGNYDWSIQISGGFVIDSGTFQAGAANKVAKADLDPNVYLLVVRNNAAITRQIRISVINATMTVYRPQRAPFARIAVPDNREELPGAGIRINGDDDDGDSTADRVDANGVAGEDDLIEVTLEINPWPAPAGYEYVLNNNNGKIKAWTTSTKNAGSEITFTHKEAVITMTAATKTIWVEWSDAGQGTADLEWIVRKANGGAVASVDKVHFYTFSSIVIMLGGEETPFMWFDGYPAPADPAPPGASTFQSAIDLHRDGYNVLMSGENAVESDGAGAVYNAVERAVQGHKITKIAMAGYSHGGGSVQDLAGILIANRATIGTFTIPLTVYIDAVENDSDQDMNQELNRPAGTAYHLNFCQNGSIGDGWLDGNATNNDNLFFNIDVNPPVPPWAPIPGGSVTHFTIEDNADLQNDVRNAIRARAGR